MSDTNGNGIDIELGNKKLHATGLVAVLLILFSLTWAYAYVDSRERKAEHSTIRSAMNRMACILTLDNSEKKIIRETPRKITDYCPWAED